MRFKTKRRLQKTADSASKLAFDGQRDCWLRSIRNSLLMLALGLSGCAGCDENQYWNQPTPDYSECPSSDGSTWQRENDDYRRSLPTDTHGCLVYNGELQTSSIGLVVRGEVCNACENRISFNAATFRGTPLLQSTFSVGGMGYASCLSSGETVTTSVESETVPLETGESLTAAAFISFRHSARVNESGTTETFKLLWPTGAEDSAFVALTDRCTDTLQLDESIHVQVVSEPFSAEVSDFLIDSLAQ